MNGRRNVFLTARREIRESLRSRAFRISIAIQVAIVVAIVIISAVSGNDSDETYEVGHTNPRAAAVVEAAAAEGGRFQVELKSESFDDAGAAESAIEAGEADAAVDGDRLLIGTDPDQALVALLQSAHAELRGGEELQDRGLSAAEIRAALQPPPLAVDELDDGSSGEGLAFIGSLYLYIVLLITGMSVAVGVTEEKSTRVVEVILAAIRPLQLLAGKVLGLGLLGLGQVLLIGVIGVGGSLALGSDDLLPPGTPEVVALVIVYFLAGYLLYACAFAAAGALVSRQEDVQSSTAPLSLLLIGGYLAGVSAAPDSTLATALTMIPPIAPMVVPARAAQDALPLWELALSLALMAVAIVALIWLAARIYERAILRMGAPLRFREALRLLRQG